MRGFIVIALTLLFISESIAQLRLEKPIVSSPLNRLYLNYSGGPIGSADFVISKDGGTFGGMYINSENSTNSQPFYGYSIDGGIRAFHYYDELSSSWRMNVNGFDRFFVNSDKLSILKDLEVSQNAIISSDLVVADSLFIINDLDQKVFINWDPSRNDIGSENMIINDDFGFGGMYINSDDTFTGAPFYGYAIGGQSAAYHYYSKFDSTWLYVHSDNSAPFGISNDDIVMYYRNIKMGEGTTFGTYLLDLDDEKNQLFFNYDYNSLDGVSIADFVLRGTGSIFSGMYIDAPQSSGIPYYGYSTEGDAQLYSYYDANADEWGIAWNDFGTVGLTVERNHSKFNGSIQVDDKATTIANAEIGTIYFSNGHFYGKINSSTVRQLDNTTNFQNDDSESKNKVLNEEIDALKKENEMLKQRIEVLEKWMKSKQ